MTRFLSFLQRLNPQELKQNEKLMTVLKDLLGCDFGKKQTSKTGERIYLFVCIIIFVNCFSTFFKLN